MGLTGLISTLVCWDIHLKPIRPQRGYPDGVERERRELSVCVEFTSCGPLRVLPLLTQSQEHSKRRGSSDCIRELGSIRWFYGLCRDLQDRFAVWATKDNFFGVAQQSRATTLINLQQKQSLGMLIKFHVRLRSFGNYFLNSIWSLWDGGWAKGRNDSSASITCWEPGGAVTNDLE